MVGVVMSTLAVMVAAMTGTCAAHTHAWSEFQPKECSYVSKNFSSIIFVYESVLATPLQCSIYFYRNLGWNSWTSMGKT
jgi:hypothetical protein